MYVVSIYSSELYDYFDNHENAFSIQAGNEQSKIIILKQLSDYLKGDIILWMFKFKVKENNSKTEIILHGTNQELSKMDISV